MFYHNSYSESAVPYLAHSHGENNSNSQEQLWKIQV